MHALVSGAYSSADLVRVLCRISLKLAKRPAQGLASTPVNKRLSTGIMQDNCRSAGAKILAPVNKRLHCTFGLFFFQNFQFEKTFGF
jgi:hypothetical protein